MGAVWKEAAETSMRAPLGRETKCGEEALSNIEAAAGSRTRTGRKHVLSVDADRSREGTTDA